MIKLRWLPSSGGVARVARLWERTRNMVRIRGGLEVLQVTRHTGRSAEVVVIVGVAVGAAPRRHRMCSRQYKVHERVIESCRRPGHCRVTLSAVRRKVRRNVVRIGGALKICEVASNARRARQIVIIIGVAIHALARRHRVSTGQREPNRGVIKLRIQPVVGAVACLAGRRKLRLHVVRIASCRKVCRVTRVALRRHQVELAVGSSLVTRIAIDRSVRPGQREAICVLLNLRNRHLPSSNRMALLAIRS